MPTAWLNAEGAAIIAHENTHKYLPVAQRVADWDYTFPSSPLAAVPSQVFSSDMTVELNRSNLALKYYGPAHTDSDISVTFPEADILRCGDTYGGEGGMAAGHPDNAHNAKRFPAGMPVPLPGTLERRATMQSRSQTGTSAICSLLQR
jgi:hypothetical protein